jgi:hypothetical protein
MADDNIPSASVRQQERLFRLDFHRCIVASCERTLVELSYYERNNWVTAEYRCERCGKEFTVKIES